MCLKFSHIVPSWLKSAFVRPHHAFNTVSSVERLVISEKDISPNAQWTCQNVGTNESAKTLYTVSPTPAATWYGRIDTSPQQIAAGSTNGQAGKFVGAESSATGVQSITAYISEDPTKAVFFLINVPYNGYNTSKCGFIDVNSNIDEAQVKRIYYDGQFGTSATHTFTRTKATSPHSGNGPVIEEEETITLYVESTIQQGKYVNAFFKYGHKKDH